MAIALEAAETRWREASVRAEEARQRGQALEEQVRELTASNRSLMAQLADCEARCGRAFAAQRKAENDAHDLGTASWGARRMQQENNDLRQQLLAAQRIEDALNQRLAALEKQLAVWEKERGLRHGCKDGDQTLWEQLCKTRARLEEAERRLKRVDTDKAAQAQRHQDEIQRLMDQRKADLESWQERFEDEVLKALRAGGHGMRFPKMEGMMKELADLKAKLYVWESNKAHDIEMEVQRRLRLARPHAADMEALLNRQRKDAEEIRRLSVLNDMLQRQHGAMDIDRQRALQAERRAHGDVSNAATREHCLEQLGAQLQLRVSDAQARGDALAQRCSALEQQPRADEAAKRQLRGANSALEQLSTEQQRQIGALAAQQEQLRRDCDHLRMQRDALGGRVADADEQLRQRRAREGELAAKLAQLEATRDRMASMEDALRTSNQQLYIAAADIQPPVSCAGHPYAPGVTPDAVLDASPQRTGR